VKSHEQHVLAIVVLLQPLAKLFRRAEESWFHSATLPRPATKRLAGQCGSDRAGLAEAGEIIIPPLRRESG
jgi:hypothetical protein